MFKASAPGSLMLLGEYAVLHGKHALVCAVDKRMTVILAPRRDQVITIRSALGYHETQISSIKATAPFEFVLTTLKQFQKKMLTGCDITIESEFSDKVGFASSAAVTVATLSTLTAWLKMPLTDWELAKIARGIVRKVQGMGSGADVAACVFGGIITYRAVPFLIKKHSHHYPISIIYSGSKTRTVEAVSRVKNSFHSYPKLFQSILRAIDQCALEGAQAVTTQNWQELGKIMNIQQGLMSALGVNTPLLTDLINELCELPHIKGAKISGSGLGDCIVGLGSLGEEYVSRFASQGASPIRAEISEQGVRCEKI